MLKEAHNPDSSRCDTTAMRLPDVKHDLDHDHRLYVSDYLVEAGYDSPRATKITCVDLLLSRIAHLPATFGRSEERLA